MYMTNIYLDISSFCGSSALYAVGTEVSLFTPFQCYTYYNDLVILFIYADYLVIYGVACRVDIISNCMTMNIRNSYHNLSVNNGF